MTSNISEMLNEKLSDPDASAQLESIMENLSTVSGSLQWIKTLHDTGMTESLKGLVYLIANLRSVLTEDMLNGIASMLNSILEILSKVSDPPLPPPTIAIVFILIDRE